MPARQSCREWATSGLVCTNAGGSSLSLLLTLSIITQNLRVQGWQLHAQRQAARLAALSEATVIATQGSSKRQTDDTRECDAKDTEFGDGLLDRL